MADPIVSWHNSTNAAEETSWNLNRVNAGEVSPDKTFLIWNNRGGGVVVADMENCSITTKDVSGGNTGNVITQKWMETKVDSMGELTYTPIGGDDVKTIQAAGGVSPGIIKGSVNTGTMAGEDIKNYAVVSVHANVPALASAGIVSFLLRVSYQF